MPRPNYKLASMTYEEAQRLIDRGAVGLLPCGAMEAHGPHLPLSTDSVVATAVAEAAALPPTLRGRGGAPLARVGPDKSKSASQLT